MQRLYAIRSMIMVMLMLMLMLMLMPVPMLMGVMAVGVCMGVLALPVLQLLEHRHFDAHGALHLQGGVGDVVMLHEEILDPAQHSRLPGLVLRLHVDVGRQREDMGADGPEVHI